MFSKSKFAALLVILFGRLVMAAELEVGQPAPGFTMQDQYLKTHNLEQYLGKWVVLYFYAKNDTPGCTKEACNFRDDIFKLRAMDAQVLGVSLDSSESHARFAEKYGLPFPLLSDAASEVAKQYGCLSKWRGLNIARHHTFIIAPDGNIAKIYRKVDPNTHSAQVLADLAALQAD
ncbi:MAG: peroxiredoxin [Gammaproteobacteria bacterium]|nr:peroxiredoxin [Gammaproteobacteria bacterium]